MTDPVATPKMKTVELQNTEKQGARIIFDNKGRAVRIRPGEAKTVFVVERQAAELKAASDKGSSLHVKSVVDGEVEPKAVEPKPADPAAAQRPVPNMLGGGAQPAKK